jgi:hypothetical protein
VVSDVGDIVVLNAALEKVWSTSIAGNDNRSLQSVCPTSDGGYIALGRSASSLVKIIKTDSLGDTLWTQDKGDASVPYFGIGVAEVSGVYIAGGIYFPGSSEKGTPGWISGYSQNGTEIWAKTKSGLSIHDLLATSSGVVLTGGVENGLSKLFKNGKKPEGALGKVSFFPSMQPFFLQIDAAGALLVDTCFNVDYYCAGNGVFKTGPTFIIAAYSQIDETGKGTHEYVVLAADESGRLLWTKKYPAPANASSPGLAAPLSSGAFVVATGDSLFCYQDATPINSAWQQFPPQQNMFRIEMRNRIVSMTGLPSDIRFDVLNIQGQIIKSVEEQSKPSGVAIFDIKGLVPGPYILEIRSGMIRYAAEKIMLGK